MRYAFTVKQVKSPVHGVLIGYQLIMALCNQARFDVRSETYTQSFAAKYRLHETGYRCLPPSLEQCLSYVDRMKEEGRMADTDVAVWY